MGFCSPGRRLCHILGRLQRRWSYARLNSRLPIIDHRVCCWAPQRRTTTFAAMAHPDSLSSYRYPPMVPCNVANIYKNDASAFFVICWLARRGLRHSAIRHKSDLALPHRDRRDKESGRKIQSSNLYLRLHSFIGVRRAARRYCLILSRSFT